MVSLVFAFIVTDPLGLLNGAGESGKYQKIQRVLKNTKSNKVLIFENKPIKNHNQYVFNESSLIHEIE